MSILFLSFIMATLICNILVYVFWEQSGIFHMSWCLETKINPYRWRQYIPLKWYTPVRVWYCHSHLVHTCQNTCFQNHMVHTCQINAVLIIWYTPAVIIIWKILKVLPFHQFPCSCLLFICLFVFKTFPTCESVFCTTGGSYSCKSALSDIQSHWSSQFVIYCLVSVCPLVSSVYVILKTPKFVQSVLKCL